MFKKLFLTAVVIFVLAAPVFVSNFSFVNAATAPAPTGLDAAGDLLDQVAGEKSGTGLSGDFAGTVATVIKTVLALVGTVFLVLTIYAGILWMTAQGEEDKVTKAKDVIKASVLGLIIIMSAYAITAFVTSRLTAATTETNNPPAAEPLGCCAPADNMGVCLDNTKISECPMGGGIGGKVWTMGVCSANCGNG
jgi:hypothetical protein